MARQKRTRNAVTGKAAQWHGVKEMQEAFTTLAKALGPDALPKYREKVKDVLMTPADMIAQEAKAMAPVKTGALRKSIRAERTLPSRDGVLIYSDKSIAWYAHIVERGTSTRKGRPFLRPAIAGIRHEFIYVIQEDFKKMLQGMASELGLRVD